MLNLNKFCSLFIGLILSVVCALPLSARDINVRGTVTNIEGEQNKNGHVVQHVHIHAQPRQPLRHCCHSKHHG